MPKTRVELVVDDVPTTTEIDNLVRNLATIKHSFEFSIRRVSGVGRGLAALGIQDYKDLIERFRKENPPKRKALPVLITSARFDSSSKAPIIHFGAHEPGRGMILSTARMGRRYAGLLRGFVSLYLADFLASTCSDTLVHEGPLGCMGDAHKTLAQLRVTLESMTICHQCRRAMKNAIAEGRLTEQRLRAIELILDRGLGRKRCFVLMPFAKRLDPLMKQVFSKFGPRDWIVNRADQSVEDPEAMNNIISGIERADLIIAVLTDNNPNVFYEVGYAHARDRARVVLLARDLSKVPFDLRNMQAEEYTTTPAGLRTLRNKLLTKYRARA